MQLYFGAPVITQDDRELGRVKEIVVHPAKKLVSHLVVQEGLFFSHDRVIPAAAVVESSPEQVRLSLPATEVEQYSAEFRAEEFIPAAEQAKAQTGTPLAGSLWTHPQQAASLPELPPSLLPPGFGPVDLNPVVSIAEDEVLLDAGASVESADGHRIGEVIQLVTDGAGGITHLRVQAGRLGRVEKLVPFFWVERIENSQVFLAVAAKQVEDLPEA
jgi:uncharacterized protein YrrD